MSYYSKYLEFKQKYLELKHQVGGSREDILRLIYNINNVVPTVSVLPISYEPPTEANSITWRVDDNRNLLGYALTREHPQLAKDGSKQLLVTRFTVYPIFSQIGYTLLRRIIDYGSSNNYRYLILESPTEISKFNNKYNQNRDYIILKI